MKKFVCFLMLIANVFSIQAQTENTSIYKWVTSDDGISNVELSQKLKAAQKGSKWGFVDGFSEWIISPVFEAASSFSKGIARVKYHGKEDHIALLTPFEFIQNEVNRGLSVWYEKGEYESSKAYEKRTNDAAKELKMKLLISDATDLYLQSLLFVLEANQTNLNEYDADNQTFLIQFPSFGNVVIRVNDAKEAASIKNNWKEIYFSGLSFVPVSDNSDGNKHLVLSKICINNPVNRKQYVWNYTDRFKYKNTKEKYNNFKEISFAQLGAASDLLSINSGTAGISGVDKNIPEAKNSNLNTYAVIIGNELYTKEETTRFSMNDARTFYKYAVKTLGIPEKNIYGKLNATYGDMLSAIDFLQKAAQAKDGDIHIIFYYSGHGMADKENKKGYLLPVDGSSKQLNAALKTETLYKSLAEMNVKSSIVFLDACFSGASNGGLLAALQDGRGVKITPKEDILQGNIVVFSATNDAQIAYPYDKEEHGIFTYFLLKKIQETKGNVSYQNLSEYVTKQVKATSFSIRQEIQTPKVQWSYELENTWGNLKLTK